MFLAESRLRDSVLEPLLAVRGRWSVLVSPGLASIVFWALLAVLCLMRFPLSTLTFRTTRRGGEEAAKFTDEGWWASAAITHQLSGRWTIPGD